MGWLRYIRLTRRQRVRVWLAIILLALTALLAAILLHLRPMLENLATARCRQYCQPHRGGGGATTPWTTAGWNTTDWSSSTRTATAA